MPQYIARRLMQLFPVLFVMSIVIFSITIVLPGDPTFTILGEEATVEQRQVLRDQMGLDDPLPIQYARWASDALSGNLGRALRSGQPITEMLAERIPVTMELAILSIMVATLIGVPAGVIAARGHNTFVDVVASSTAMIAMAVPYFWQGILMILLFSLSLRWLPPSGYMPFFDDPIENLRLMVMPTLTIGTSLAAVIARQTRTSMLQVLSEDYIRTAHAKGISDFQVLVNHALRNALLPVVTIIGLQLATLLGGTLVTERIFSLPGLGLMMVDGIFQRDFFMVQGSLLVFVGFVVVINLITDIFYGIIDPRIRY